jgi:hypothetical protein
MPGSDEKKAGWKERFFHEFYEFLAIFLFLALFFCAFATYRRILMREMGFSYFHYGFAAFKALILAKVILLGQYAKVAKIFDNRPLIVPTLYKVVLFSLFALAFEILEHLVGGFLHGQGLRAGFQEILSVGRDELLARTLVVLVAFVPFFAFSEIGRLLGEGRLGELFFHRRAADEPGLREGD